MDYCLQIPIIINNSPFKKGEPKDRLEQPGEYEGTEVPSENKIYLIYNVFNNNIILYLFILLYI